MLSLYQIYKGLSSTKRKEWTKSSLHKGYDMNRWAWKLKMKRDDLLDKLNKGEITLE